MSTWYPVHITINCSNKWQSRKTDVSTKQTANLLCSTPRLMSLRAFSFSWKALRKWNAPRWCLLRWKCMQPRLLLYMTGIHSPDSVKSEVLTEPSIFMAFLWFPRKCSKLLFRYITAVFYKSHNAYRIIPLRALLCIDKQRRIVSLFLIVFLLRLGNNRVFFSCLVIKP